MSTTWDRWKRALDLATVLLVRQVDAVAEASVPARLLELVEPAAGHDGRHAELHIQKNELSVGPDGLAAPGELLRCRILDLGSEIAHEARGCAPPGATWRIRLLVFRSFEVFQLAARLEVVWRVEPA